MPKTTLFNPVQQQILPSLQSLGDYLSEKEKDEQWDKKILAAAGEEVSIIDAVGDGNCGPRAVIQAILLDGFAQTDKTEHISYLRGLFERQCTRVNEEISKLAQDNKLLNTRGSRCQTEYKTFWDNELWTKTQFSKFIDDYENCCNASKISQFSQKYFRFDPSEHSKDASLQNDVPVFYLAACLRFDIDDYWTKEAPKDEQYKINTNEYKCVLTMDEIFDMGEIAQSYFVKRKINFNSISKVDHGQSGFNQDGHDEKLIFKSEQNHLKSTKEKQRTDITRQAIEALENSEERKPNVYNKCTQLKKTLAEIDTKSRNAYAQVINSLQRVLNHKELTDAIADEESALENAMNGNLEAKVALFRILNKHVGTSIKVKDVLQKSETEQNFLAHKETNLTGLEEGKQNQLWNSLFTNLYNQGYVTFQNGVNYFLLAKRIDVFKNDLVNQPRSSDQLEHQRKLATYVIEHPKAKALSCFKDAQQKLNDQTIVANKITEDKLAAIELVEKEVGGALVLQKYLIENHLVSAEIQAEMEKISAVLNAYEEAQAAPITCKVLNRGGHYVTLVTDSTMRKFQGLLSQDNPSQEQKLSIAAKDAVVIAENYKQKEVEMKDDSEKLIAAGVDLRKESNKNTNHTVVIPVLKEDKSMPNAAETQDNKVIALTSDQIQLKFLTGQFDDAKSSTAQYQKKIEALMQKRPETNKDFNDLRINLYSLRNDCKNIKKLLGTIKLDKLVSDDFKNNISAVAEQAKGIITTIDDYERSNTFIFFSQKWDNPLISPKAPPMSRNASNTTYTDDYTAEQESGYGFPIALTLAGMGSVGILAVGVSLGIVTSPVLIMVGFAIAGLIPVVWLMHWLINARPATEPSSTEASQPSEACYQALVQKITTFFSLEKKVSDQKHVTHQPTAQQV